MVVDPGVDSDEDEPLFDAWEEEDVDEDELVAKSNMLVDLALTCTLFHVLDLQTGLPADLQTSRYALRAASTLSPHSPLI